MTSKCSVLGFAALLLSASIASAEPRTYHPVVDPSRGSGITFHISYSLGTHDGTAQSVTGNLELKSMEPLVASGEFRVPIRSLKTGNAERDCHLLESLGLNYADTAYPAEHVCNGENQLPATGKSSVAFSDIALKVISVAKEEAGLRINGEWTIHGITKPVQFVMKMTPSGDQLRLQGELPFRLKDYGVVVKSAHVLFATISAGDTATAVFDMTLKPAESAQAN